MTRGSLERFYLYSVVTPPPHQTDANDERGLPEPPIRSDTTKPKTGFALSGKVARGKVPVHHVPERVEVLRAFIATVDVIGVFPNVAGEQRTLVAAQRIFGVVAGDQTQLAT